VSVYGWHTIPGDQTTLTETAKDVFERYVLRDVGGGPLPSYNLWEMQTEKRHLYGEAG
jgi:hypothetical protein